MWEGIQAEATAVGKEASGNGFQLRRGPVKSMLIGHWGEGGPLSLFLITTATERYGVWGRGLDYCTVPSTWARMFADFIRMGNFSAKTLM